MRSRTSRRPLAHLAEEGGVFAALAAWGASLPLELIPHILTKEIRNILASRGQ